MFGKLGDTYGHRKLFLIGLAGSAAGALATAAAPTAATLIAFRIIAQGFGAGPPADLAGADHAGVPGRSATQGDGLVVHGRAHAMDSSSKKWEDKGFSLGMSVYSNFSPISGVDDASCQGLFPTKRYDLVGGSDMTYTLKVPPGPYLVTLYFCEIYVGGPGSRKFDVNIQGTTVLSDFDIFAVAGGGFKVVSRTFQVSVAQGNDLVIKFISRVNNAKVLAIQVNSSAVSPTPPAPTPNCCRLLLLHQCLFQALSNQYTSMQVVQHL